MKRPDTLYLFRISFTLNVRRSLLFKSVSSDHYLPEIVYESREGDVTRPSQTPRPTRSSRQYGFSSY